MIRFARSLVTLFGAMILSGMAVSSPLSAQQPAAGWSNEQFAFALGGGELLEYEAREALFQNERLRAEIRRTGVHAACEAIETAVATNVARQVPTFHAWALPTLKALIPLDVQATTRADSIAPGGWHRIYGQRLMRRLRAERPEILSAMLSAATSDALAGLSRLPSTSGDWRQRFADWDFTRAGIPYQAACTIESHKSPELAKVPFDGFYSTRGK